MKKIRSGQGRSPQQKEAAEIFACFSLVFLFLSIVLSFIL